MPRKIDECFAAIDVLGSCLTLLGWRYKLENLKVRRAADIDDTPDSYQDLYTPIFTNIIDVVQEYLCHQFKNF